MKKYYYCIFFAIIEMLTGNFLYAFDKKIITDELSTLTYDRLIVYGTKTCSYTNSMRGYLAQNRIQYIFKDIDNHAGAESEMWDIVYNSSWFTSGSVSLPIVAVNDIAYERPSTTTVSFLLNSGNGIVNHELTGIVSGEVRLESVNGEGVQAEIDLFNISSSGEFYHICYSDSQGVYECNGVIPGEYKIIIKRNGIINEQQFLNGYVQNGQIFSVKEKETVDAMNTVVFEKNVAKKYIRKLPSSNPDSLLWSHPDSKTNNYIYYTQYSSFYSMNAITSENQNIFHDDGGYLKVIRHAPSRKIITLSSSNDKLFIIDADSSSSTFHTVIKTIDCEQTLGLTINNAEDTAYAVGMQEISVIDLATGTIKTKIGLSGYAQDDLELDEEHNRAYVIVYSQSSNPVNHLAVIDIDPNSSTFNTELKLIPIVHDRCSCLYFDYPYAYADSSHSADYADNRFLFRINVLTEETKKIQLLDNQVDSIINTSKEVIYYIDIDDKLLNNFRINTFSLPKNETIQTEYLPSGAKYYVLNIAEDSSSLIVFTYTKNVYTFPIATDGRLLFTYEPPHSNNKYLPFLNLLL